MMHRVAVVGASGRVGRAIAGHLSQTCEVVRIARRSPDDDDFASLVRQAVDEQPAVLINAAGVAHLSQQTQEDLRRLELGNVELPAALAAAALGLRIPMIHISSAKAADRSATSPYAASKRRGDERLEHDFDDEFVAAGLALAIVRPRALLFPPFDAGRLRRLEVLRWCPEALVAPIRVPVLSPTTFLSAVEALVVSALTGAAPAGVSHRDFDRSEWGTLRDVRQAFGRDARLHDS